VSHTARTPRPAATILLLREGDDGCEVLMLRRHGRSGFAAGAWVFPGGTVDAEDRTLSPRRYAGLNPSQLTGRFADPAEAVLGFHVAAVRETFEEAGILFTECPIDADERERARVRLGARTSHAREFMDFLDDHDLVLRLGALVYLSRWITPRVEGRRFDTAFFVAAVPVDQVARHDAVETTAKRWVRPAAALDAHRDGRFDMIHPTVKTLEWLAEHHGTEDALAAAAARPTVPWVLPHVEEADDGSWSFLHPTHPDFPWPLYTDELRGPVE
jgi:8-oxo-dGTP pyrophosphatase MutT (NUDIX family)